MELSGKHGQKNRITYSPNYQQLPFAIIIILNINMRTSVICVMLSEYSSCLVFILFFFVIKSFSLKITYHSFHRAFSHSKSKKTENIRCSHCHGSISIFLNKKQGNEYVLVPVRKANGFANFVKEKYKDFKKPGVTHAEVMRQISTLFATLSLEEKKKY